MRLRLALVLFLFLALGLFKETTPLSAKSADSAAAQQTGATEPLSGAVLDALIRLLGQPLETDALVSNIMIEGEWAFGTVAMLAGETGAPDAYLFLARRQGKQWQAALSGEPQFELWRSQAPAAFPLLRSSPDVSITGDGSAQLSLPWATGETWTLTGGPHHNTGSANRPWSALDFAGGSGIVRPARDGVAYRPCDNFVLVDHGDGWQTGYYHLINIGVAHGQAVSRGTHPLGQISTAVGCGGSATGPHVHFTLRRNGQHQEIHDRDIGGWTVQEGGAPYQGCMVRGSMTRCAPGGQIYNDGTISSGSPPPPPPSCPQSGGVILYQHGNYDCGGAGEGVGYVLRSGAGFQNVPGAFNDKASSIRIPSGWSVKLYEHSERGGGSRCIDAPGDADFAGKTFNNGVSLNDNVSSFEVFTGAGCGASVNRPPNTPQPTSPGDWHVARDGRAPTLCWQNNGDPDGDSVQFFAEVFESAVNAQSGWIHDACWRPSQLDGRSFNYQWRVKARDSRGAESGWSAIWHFTIEPAPAPPDAPWRAQYWNNKTLSGSPARERDEGGVYLFRDWDSGAPLDGVSSDGWSARFTKTLYFPGGAYRFHCQHDDGCRIYIDGQLRLDAWWDSSFDGHDWSGYLSPGNHEIKVEFYENTGAARLEAWWQGPGFLPPEQTCVLDAWCGEYWGNRGLSGTPAMRRNEGPVLSLNWHNGGPEATFPSDNFSSRFRRNADFACGVYRFFINADDGVRFWVDDALRLDRWRDQTAAFTVDVELSAGIHALRVEHYERSGGASIGVHWEKMSDCAANTVVEHASIHYVKPWQEITPIVRMLVSAGALDGERGDHLAHVGGETFGAAPAQPIFGRFEAGQSYTFDAANSANFVMTAPATPGVYESHWRVSSNGALVGETATVRIVVDDAPPSIVIAEPVDGAFLNSSLVLVRAEAGDDVSGVEQVQFIVGYKDGTEWVWRNLGWDLDGSDGWSVIWDASAAPDQPVALFAYAWDRAGNGAGVVFWNVILDRTAPSFTFDALPAALAANVVTVRWNAHDPVAGVERIDVQVRRDEGDWEDWLTNGVEGQGSARFIGEPGHRYAFRAQAFDRAGNVRLYPDAAEVEAAIDLCTPDAYEPDDSVHAPRLLEAGASQQRTFCGVGDEDWVAVWMEAGGLYTLRTADLAEHSDTVLTLYAGDGVTVLAENDDSEPGATLASQIVWRADATGWHYVRVRHWDARIAGDAVSYVLQFEAEPLKARFEVDAMSGMAPLTVQFTDHSTGAIDRYAWDFGDGQASAEQNPVHTYAEPGMYVARLSVFGAGGASDVYEQTILVQAQPVESGSTLYLPTIVAN